MIRGYVNDVARENYRAYMDSIAFLQEFLNDTLRAMFRSIVEAGYYPPETNLLLPTVDEIGGALRKADTMLEALHMAGAKYEIELIKRQWTW